jgi:hypothetical protein
MTFASCIARPGKEQGIGGVPPPVVLESTVRDATPETTTGRGMEHPMLDTSPRSVASPASADEPQVGLAARNDEAVAPAFAVELEHLRSDLKRLLDQQQELMQLLGTKRPDKLIHDVRNLLQERMFLEAACKRFEG